MREGKGIHYYKNGDEFKGTWKNHIKHGFGIYKYNSGKEEGAVYEDGKLVKT